MNQELQVRKEVEVVAGPLLSQIAVMQVSDVRTYAAADSLLSRVRQARKLIAEKMAGILDPINQARKAALELSHSLDDPLSDAEASIKAQMKQYKIEEHDRALEEERKAHEESARLWREAEEKRKKEESAKTQTMRDRLAKQRAELEVAAKTAEVVPVPVPFKVAGSTTRSVQKWRVKDLSALLKAAADPNSAVPEDVFCVNSVAVNALFRNEPTTVASWPGIEIYEDVSIVAK